MYDEASCNVIWPSKCVVVLKSELEGVKTKEKSEVEGRLHGTEGSVSEGAAQSLCCIA